MKSFTHGPQVFFRNGTVTVNIYTKEHLVLAVTGCNGNLLDLAIYFSNQFCEFTRPAT